LCGLSGFVAREPVTRLDDSLDSIRHRGPDASGHWQARIGDRAIGLGHVRLSILDLTDAANQPFRSSDGRCAVVYNGEIYNYAEIRTELSAMGHRFRTHSDTEVLIAAYRHWGIDSLRRFEGMFAFVLVDLDRKRLLMARDPLGIKPIYYARCGVDSTDLLFCSELRGLAALLGRSLEPDPTAFAEFLLNGFLYEPATGFRGVEKLEPGSYAELDLQSGRLTHARYFDPAPRSTGGHAEGLEAQVRESMRMQCVADVPVGLFFSGGVDSTTLALYAPRELDALYVDYGDDRGDSDRRYAMAVSQKLGLRLSTVQHRPEESGPEAILDSFRRVARGTEEPISDYTYIASEALARHARDSGFKVMLSGMGGDELFAGYPRYLLAHHRNAVRAVNPLLRLAAPLLSSSSRLEKKTDRLIRFASEPDLGRAYTSLVGYFSVDEVDSLLGTRGSTARFHARLTHLLEPVRNQTDLKKAMLLDRYGFLSHNLTVTDRSSMSQGVEIRVPLMSRDLANTGITMRDDELISGRGTKRPLKRLLAKHLPRALVHRPKVGFNPPLDGKIDMLGRSRILENLAAGPFSDVCDLSVARSMVDAHFEKRSNNTYRIWQLIYFNEWMRAHV